MIIVDFKNFIQEFYCTEKNISELNQFNLSLSKDFISDENYLLLLSEFRNSNKLLKNESKILHPTVIVRTKYLEVTYYDAIISSIDNSNLCINFRTFSITRKHYSNTNLLLEIIKTNDVFDKIKLRYRLDSSLEIGL